jgi:hypothetical protein
MARPEPRDPILLQAIIGLGGKQSGKLNLVAIKGKNSFLIFDATP